MKARVLDAREQLRRAVDKQIRQQYDEQAAGIAREMARKEVYAANAQFAEDFDACVLYALHEVCGFGRVRLTRFSGGIWSCARRCSTATDSPTETRTIPGGRVGS